MNAGDHGTSDVAKIYASSRSKKRIAFMFVKVAERRRECRPPQSGWKVRSSRAPPCSFLRTRQSFGRSPKLRVRASEIRRRKLDGRLRKKETLQMKKNTVEEQEERGEETIVRGMLCGTVQMCGDF